MCAGSLSLFFLLSISEPIACFSKEFLPCSSSQETPVLLFRFRWSRRPHPRCHVARETCYKIDRLAQRQKPPQSLKVEIESKVAKGTPSRPQSKACDLDEKPAFWPACCLSEAAWTRGQKVSRPPLTYRDSEDGASLVPSSREDSVRYAQSVPKVVLEQ